MIIRSKELPTPEDKQKASKDSLDYAKKAVTVDLKDAESWCIFI